VGEKNKEDNIAKASDAKEVIEKGSKEIEEEGKRKKSLRKFRMAERKRFSGYSQLDCDDDDEDDDDDDDDDDYNYEEDEQNDEEEEENDEEDDKCDKEECTNDKEEEEDELPYLGFIVNDKCFLFPEPSDAEFLAASKDIDKKK